MLEQIVILFYKMLTEAFNDQHTRDDLKRTVGQGPLTIFFLLCIVLALIKPILSALSREERQDSENLATIFHFIRTSAPKISEEDSDLYERRVNDIDVSHHAALICPITHDLMRFPVKLSGVYLGRRIEVHYEWHALLVHLFQAYGRYYRQSEEYRTTEAGRAILREPYTGISLLDASKLKIELDPILQSQVFTLLKAVPAIAPVSNAHIMASRLELNNRPGISALPPVIESSEGLET